MFHWGVSHKLLVSIGVYCIVSVCCLVLDVVLYCIVCALLSVNVVLQLAKLSVECAAKRKELENEHLLVQQRVSITQRYAYIFYTILVQWCPNVFGSGHP